MKVKDDFTANYYELLYLDHVKPENLYDSSCFELSRRVPNDHPGGHGRKLVSDIQNIVDDEITFQNSATSPESDASDSTADKLISMTIFDSNRLISPCEVSSRSVCRKSFAILHRFSRSLVGNEIEDYGSEKIKRLT
jgi:hypothetical protein